MLTYAGKRQRRSVSYRDEGFGVYSSSDEAAAEDTFFSHTHRPDGVRARGGRRRRRGGNRERERAAEGEGGVAMCAEAQGWAETEDGRVRKKTKKEVYDKDLKKKEVYYKDLESARSLSSLFDSDDTEE
jgi:hypothetical protein